MRQGEIQFEQMVVLKIDSVGSAPQYVVRQCQATISADRGARRRIDGELRGVSFSEVAGFDGSGNIARWKFVLPR